MAVIDTSDLLSLDELAHRIWGEFYEQNSEYLLHLQSIRAGRARSAVMADLRERLARLEQNKVVRDLGPLPLPYASEYD